MKKDKSNILSIILTIFVIGIYLIPNFASALEVTLNKEEYNKDDKIIFHMKLESYNTKINNITLIIDNKIICKTCSYTKIKENFGYGYGYGYNNFGYGYGYGYNNFGYGYGGSFGYGYGYGYGNYDNYFEGQLEHTFNNLNSGEHTYKIIINSKYKKEGSFKVKEEVVITSRRTSSAKSKPKQIDFTVKINKQLVTLMQGKDITINNVKITLSKVYDDYVIIKINPEYTINVGENITYNNINIYLEKILYGKAYLYFSEIELIKDVIENKTIEEEPKPIMPDVIEEEKGFSILGILGIILIVIICGIIYFGRKD